MTMNSDSVIKGFDVFKNQVICVSVILNVKTVKPFPFYEWMEGFNAVIVTVLWFLSGKAINSYKLLLQKDINNTQNAIAQYTTLDQKLGLGFTSSMEMSKNK